MLLPSNAATGGDRKSISEISCSDYHLYDTSLKKYGPLSFQVQQEPTQRSKLKGSTHFRALLELGRKTLAFQTLSNKISGISSNVNTRLTDKASAV